MSPMDMTRQPAVTRAHPQRRRRRKPKTPTTSKEQTPKMPYLAAPVPKTPRRAAKALSMVTSSRNMLMAAMPGRMPVGMGGGAGVGSVVAGFMGYLEFTAGSGEKL